MEQLALLARECKDREKGQKNNSHGEKDRAPDQVSGVAHCGHHGPSVTRVNTALLHEAEGVLGHHNSSIYQDANGDSNPSQRHDIGADPDIAHAEKGRQDRQGQGDGDNQHRAQMHQKNDVHQGDNDGLLDQGMLECSDSPGNEPGAVVKRYHPHARREPGGDGLELGLDAVDDVDRAHPIARHHDATNRFVGPFDEGTGSEGVADLHLGHLPDKDRDSILGADDDMLDIVNIFDEPEPTNDRPGAARLDDVPSNIAITAHDRVHDRRKRDTEGAQAVRLHINLILPHGPTDTGHLGDARHGVKLIADVPVLE
jgi:hypothetical protein